MYIHKTNTNSEFTRNNTNEHLPLGLRMETTL